MSGDTCGNDAAYRFTWPGSDESFICEEHAKHLRGVAGALGLHLQLIPLDPEDAERCRQNTERRIMHE